VLKPDRIIVERRPDPVYERLFPYYVELCATSQFRSKLKGEGGVAGHAVMYIKGACKDGQAPYRQLRRCRVAATELDDPEHGAGVSVGRWFRNVNWVATPGYELFYQGNLKIGERLTQAYFEATAREAIDKGASREKYREFCSSGPPRAAIGSECRAKYNSLRSNSLRIGTGNLIRPCRELIRGHQGIFSPDQGIPRRPAISLRR
jgi:hypothetical protein